MTKTMMNHRDCDHPATKAGRAACRREHAARATRDAIAKAAIRDCYYTEGIDAEEILGMIHQLGLPINPDDDLETIIASL